jgi:K+-sensing histidine kinase KdpD
MPQKPIRMYFSMPGQLLSSAVWRSTNFHAFQPIADQRPMLREGLGLGLSIRRTVIEAMDGSTGVASKPGHGDRFWFTLPLAASAQRVSSTRH